MSAATAILVTLIVYKIALLAIGFFAQRRTRDQSDFILGGRGLGPLVAAISASASSSSVWTLLGVSTYAYTQGLSAIWLFPSCVGGFALNWYVIAPRLRKLSIENGALTLTDALAGPATRPGRRTIVVLAALMTLLALTIYVASQLQGAGKLFAAVFEDLTDEPASGTTMILLGAAIVVIYTMLGGFWAVSITDTLQGLMMALTAIALPIAALAAVGGPGALLSGLGEVEIAGFDSAFSGFGTAGALGLALGLLGIGLGYPGQPHVVNRFMALESDAAIRPARRYAMAWAVIVYAGMITVGLAGRVIESRLEPGEEIFFVLTGSLFDPIIAGIMIAAVLSAIMSTADSQLLVAASSVTHDLGAGRGNALKRTRIAVLTLTTAAVVFALLLPKSIFDNVLSAWTALGAAFGPLLAVALWRGLPSVRVSAATMVAGFATAMATHIGFTLDRDERWVSQVLPYVAALAVCLTGQSVTARPKARRGG